TSARTPGAGGVLSRSHGLGDALPVRVPEAPHRRARVDRLVGRPPDGRRGDGPVRGWRRPAAPSPPPAPATAPARPARSGAAALAAARAPPALRAPLAAAAALARARHG